MAEFITYCIIDISVMDVCLSIYVYGEAFSNITQNPSVELETNPYKVKFASTDVDIIIL